MSEKYIALDGRTIKRGSEKVRIEIRCFENRMVTLTSYGKTTVKRFQCL